MPHQLDTISNAPEKIEIDQSEVKTTENHEKEIYIKCNESVTNVKEEPAFKDDVDDIENMSVQKEDYDGGYGWLVVLGGFLFQITSFGEAASWYVFSGTTYRVMQDYYDQHTFKDSPNALVNLSFVGTLSLIFLNGMSPFTQMATSIFGLRPVMIAGVICIVLGLELASLSTQVWHLYLTQGIMFGIGISCMYVNVVAIAPQWFTKNRGVAMGIISSGTGMGGLINPFIMQSINQKLGPGWTYRIIGFICFTCAVLACILVRERVPTKQKKKKFSQIIQFDVLKNTNFLLYLIGSDIALFGFFVPYFFIPSNATYLGLTDSQGSIIVAVGSGCNFVGRIFVGILGDRFGKLNCNILFNLIAGLSNLLIWTFANNFGTLMAFSVVFGFTSGSYFALMSPISATILPIDRFHSGLSLILFTNAFPVFGSNIASAIQSGVNAAPFISYKMFTGVVYVIGALILIILKLRLNKNIFAII